MLSQLPLRGVDQIQFLGQVVCRRGVERRVQAGDVMRIEVVANKRDAFRVWVVFVDQTFHFLCPIDTPAAFATDHTPPTSDRVEEQEDRSNANPLVMVIFPPRLARCEGQRRFQVGGDLFGRFIHAD
jgi:hypothetical protein